MMVSVFVYLKCEDYVKSDNKDDILNAAFPAGWGPLTPPEQSMAIAAQILAGEFESLVSYDMQGNLVPQLATSWDVSNDLKIITFTIDTTRRFSNGDFLNASIIKKSFENSLSIVPASSNVNTLDALNQVEGFENFKKRGELSGIQAPSPDKLILKFKKPFRRALAFLSGIRYAAYMVVDGNKFIGTGPYYIESATKKEVFLSKNQYYPAHSGFNRIHISGLESSDWEQAMCDNKFDVYYSLDINRIKKCGSQKESNIDFTGGALGGHITLSLNGLNGRFFSNPKLRMAIQYLVVENILPKLADYLNMDRVALDPQFIAPLQQGRLSDVEAKLVIDEGKKWVPQLIALSQKNPIYYPLRDKKDEAISAMLRELGLGIRNGPSLISIQESSEAYYKTFDYDVLYRGAGFGAQDVDDLYHVLGRHGAIGSPTIQRENVMLILEQGRSALTSEEIRDAYKNISGTILREVPAIHLGYLREGFLYDHSRVKVQSQSMNTMTFNYTQISPTWEY